MLRDYFSECGFMFKDKSQVKIISGKEEALFAWISANYLENNFVTLMGNGHLSAFLLSLVIFIDYFIF